MKKKFFWKSFVSFSLFWTFFIILFSGVILYIAPPGRVANWSDWKLFAFTKTQWQAIHTIFSYTFAILSIFHLFTLNWKAFWSYIRTKAINGLNKRNELIISIVLTLFIFSGAIFNFQPFKAVIDFGEWTTESWEKKDEQAPIPHTEILTIRELSEKYIKISPDSIVTKLKLNNIKVDSAGQTLAKIGELNNVTPAQLYSIIVSKTTGRTEQNENSDHTPGLGRKSLNEVATLLNKDVNSIINILKENKIIATSESTIKDIADEAGKTPKEIFDLINK
jgi:hypothetical protein